MLISVFGPNGCGKSTLINMIAGLMPIDSNKILFDGKNLKAALNSIKNFDTGGLIGVPITIKGNSVAVGRIYRADIKAQKMVPASDWIAVE